MCNSVPCVQPQGCPSWCRQGAGAHDWEQAGNGALVRAHEVTLGRLQAADIWGSSFHQAPVSATVTLQAYEARPAEDGPSLLGASQVGVWVDRAQDILAAGFSPTEARQLAALLVEAARLVDVADRAAAR